MYVKKVITFSPFISSIIHVNDRHNVSKISKFISSVILSLHARFEVSIIFPSTFFNFWHISLIIHENDVIMDVMPKKRACSTCTIILWTQCHKNRRKKLFVENLHAAVTYPLHYINPSLSNLKPYSFCELTQYPVQMSGIKYILIGCLSKVSVGEIFCSCFPQKPVLRFN